MSDSCLSASANSTQTKQQKCSGLVRPDDFADTDFSGAQLRRRHHGYIGHQFTMGDGAR
jgi:hypothetical protein